MDGLAGATLALLTDPFGFLLFACALTAGLFTGIVPGLNVIAVAAVALPLTLSLPPSYTMTVYGALFVSGAAGRWAVATSAGGQQASVETAGTGVVRVMLAGVIAALLAAFLVEGVAGYVFFGFKAPEMFAVAFCALAAVAGIGARRGAKGLLSLLLGLLLGMSLAGPISDGPRYVLGGLDILSGLTFVPLLVGFVVLPDVIAALSRKPAVVSNPSSNRIILSAAATNAALLPLIALGLPLSMGAVVVVAALGLQDMAFGPLFIIEAEEVAWALLAAAAWAALLAPLLGILMANRPTFLRKIAAPVVAAGLVVLATAGVYALDARMADVYAMFGAGLVGYFLRRQGYPLAFVILGMVLVQIVEPAYVGAVSVLDSGLSELFRRPVSAVLIVSGLLAMAAGAFWKTGPGSRPGIGGVGETDGE